MTEAEAGCMRSRPASGVLGAQRRGPDAFKFLHFVLEFISLSELVSIKPLDGLLNGILNLLLVCWGELRSNLIIIHDCDLRNTPRCRRDARELEFSKQVVVPGPCSLTFIDLNQHTRLVIRVGRENLLFLGGDGSVSWDQNSHDTTSSFKTKRKWGDIQKQQVLDLLITLATQDSSLHSSTIGNGFIRIDALAELLTIEEVLQQLLDLGNSSGATNKYNIMDSALVHLGISQTLLDWFHTLPKKIHVQLFKSGTCDGGVEINTLKERVNFNRGCSQPSESPRVPRNVLLVLSLEFLNKVINHPVIKVFTSKMCVTSSGLDLKDTLLDGWNSNHGILHSGTKVGLSNFSHLDENHRRDLFRSKLLLFTFVIDNNHGLITRSRDDLKRPQLDVTLHR
nr:NAD-specific glutamate dehydrogenase [Ipomoea batatas]